jgi:hypothetical protein
MYILDIMIFKNQSITTPMEPKLIKFTLKIIHVNKLKLPLIMYLHCV